MLNVRNEAELSKLGLKIHPSDPTQVVPLNEPSEALPSESWTLDQLGQYAAAGVAEVKRLNAEVACLARKSSVQIFWAGAALAYAQPKLKAEGKKWTAWLKERKIPRTNAWEATELYRLAKDVKEVEKLPLAKAKKKFGVTKLPKAGRQGETFTGNKPRKSKPASPKQPRKRSGKALGIDDEKGIQPQRNFHPCVKPIAVTSWLSRLILPPEQTKPHKMLVPFCGSGSEMIGAMLEGWDVVLGIEREQKYIDIANARIEWWKSQNVR
jgi:hypothetical protein